MSKKDDETKSENARPNTTGSVSPENEELARWIIRLWSRGEVPERVEVYQTFGRNRNNRGERIFHEDYKPNEKLSNEQAVKLSNEILSECQHDCDSLPASQIRNGATYQIAVIDRNRRSEPLVRRIGPLTPKRSYALVKVGDEDDDDLDDGETPRDAKALELKYMQEGMEQVRWDKRRYDGVMGEMLLLYHNTVEQLRNQNGQLMDRVMLFFDKVQEAQDRSLDRELIREKEKFKLSMYRDGIRTAQNMLPRLFAGVESHKKEGNGHGHANGAMVAAAAGVTPEEASKVAYGPSPERTLIDNFLQGCEDEGEDLLIKLFGDFEERDGKLVQVKPGIFSLQQYAVLLGVRDGKLSPDAVDPLMPNSGHDLCIKQEQIVKAMEAGVTQGLGTAIIELVGLRQAKNDGDDDNFTEAEENE
jgi:hypothetical protein